MGTDQRHNSGLSPPPLFFVLTEVLGDADTPIWTLVLSSVAMATQWALWWVEEGQQQPGNQHRRQQLCPCAVAVKALLRLSLSHLRWPWEALGLWDLPPGSSGSQ